LQQGRTAVRKFARLAGQTARWLAVVIAVLAWLVVVPLVELVTSVLAWCARRVEAAFRRSF
jgi:hypothetical protein